MNRIYKVIWSKVKHQYVVVSELAHSCTKSTGSRVGRSAAAVLAALVLTMGVGSVQAEFLRPTGADYIQNDNGNLKVYDDGGVSFGNGAFNIGPDGQFRVPGENGDTYFTPDDLVSAVESGETADVALEKATNAENKNTEQDNRLNGIDKKNDSQDASIDAINQKNDSQDASIDAINQKNDSQDASIDAINQKNGQQDTQINTINKQIGANPDGSLSLTNGEKTLVGGINANSAAIAQNRQDINNLNHRVDNLDSRIDKVGAGAAALAALHPLDFDPDAKWDFAAGYGNYNGENAVAVGTFYRPNEDTMFSVGGTFGNGENMINAGVSLKIGAGSSHVTTSRTAMAKEIKSMRDIVAKQDAQIQKLTAMVNALVGVQTETDTTTMFPDVPENHWAYEAVAAMAKSGLVKGYPDGEFKGDRNMTRYEFAQIVYNAIQAGAEVDARLVEEFKPELEYFHIATVAKDKDGNPTIERVRAN